MFLKCFKIFSKVNVTFESNSEVNITCYTNELNFFLLVALLLKCNRIVPTLLLKSKLLQVVALFITNDCQTLGVLCQTKNSSWQVIRENMYYQGMGNLLVSLFNE